MKKLSLFCSYLLVIIPVFAISGLTIALQWDSTDFDFGSIPQGEAVSHTFLFTNNGNEAIEISNVSTSCGCTVAEYSTEAIDSGKEGFVSLEYNAQKKGVFAKKAYVQTASGESFTLSLRGEVVE